MREGVLRVQDAGSQLTARALAQAPVPAAEGRAERWLDLCAGPCGKAALLAALAITPAGGLDGLAMSELSTATRVVALQRADGYLEHPPRRGTRFLAGDRAFVVGPYDELLRVLQQQDERV